MSQQSSLVHKPERARREVLAWIFAFALAAAWPIFAFAYPAGMDTPNHMARAYILLHPQDPLLNARFEIVWHATPDLIWDGFAVATGQIIPLVWSLKLFMLLGLVLPIAGIALLNHRITGRWTWIPLLATPFLFHLGYSRGFLGFNVAFGLGLVAIGIWLHGSERYWGRRLVVACLLSTALFFAHLVAWGTYGLAILGLKLAELHADWRIDGRKALLPWLARTMRDGLQAAPPLAILAIATLLSSGGAALIGSVAPLRPPWLRFVDAWHVIDTGWYLPSLPILAVVAGFLFYLLLWRRAVRFDVTLAVPIALLVLMFFA
ncbi:MAG: hypothetical protein KKB37_03685, partial [Alphaproteobacteria bacterium]|nr:hypothetical protein [Alphaproteobacteria bacterium]